MGIDRTSIQRHIPIYRKTRNKGISVGLLLLTLVVVIMPINGTSLSELPIGEIGYETADLVGLGLIGWAVARVLIDKRMPRLPALTPIMVFVGWTFLSASWNLPSITDMVFKGRPAVGKLVTQEAMLVFGLLLAFSVAIVCRSVGFKRVMRAVILSATASSILVLLYGAWEIIWSVHGGHAGLFSAIDLHLHVERQQLLRVRSLAGEPSWLGEFLALAVPVLALRAIRFKERWPTILFYALLAISLLTFSRTVYAILLTETIALCTLLWASNRRELFRLGAKLMIAAGLLVTLLVLLSIGGRKFTPTKVVESFSSHQSNPYDQSNNARMTMMKAAAAIGISHPLLGVGLGQFGFWAPQYVRKTNGNTQLRGWLSGKVGTPWPPSHDLYARILAEMGIIGLGLWLSMVAYLTWYAARRVPMEGHNHLILAVWMIGVSVFFIGFNSFRSPGIWLAMGLISGYGSD